MHYNRQRRAGLRVARLSADIECALLIVKACAIVYADAVGKDAEEAAVRELRWACHLLADAEDAVQAAETEPPVVMFGARSRNARAALGMDLR